MGAQHQSGSLSVSRPGGRLDLGEPISVHPAVPPLWMGWTPGEMALEIASQALGRRSLMDLPWLLARAIEDEAYEHAAVIRDRLAGLQGE
jgi:hypothetical protein